MELNIRGHLFRELFEEKTVACNKDLYARSYPVLWPCEDAFREFLATPDVSIQMSAAKTIYVCIGAEEDVFLPQFTWKNLIFLQQTHLADRPRSYIAQDHVIHSVSLYVLGIYAFFNMPIFQRKILRAKDSLSDTEDERLIRFIKKWKMFSFYHDLGYVFESLVGRDGDILEQQILSTYKDLPGCILSECVSRSVSRQIVATALARKGRTKFWMDENIFIGTRWLNEARKEETPQALVQMLNRCKDYSLLEDIQAIEGLHPLAPLLRRTAGLAVVEKQRGCPLAFVKWENNGDSCIIYRSDDNLPMGVLYAVRNMLPLDFLGVSICYYLCLEDFKQRFLDCSGAYKAFQSEAQQFDSYLPERLRRQFSLIYHDSCISQAFYEICDWHQTHWQQMNREQEQQGGTLDKYGETLTACFSKAIREGVTQEAQAALKNAEIAVENLEEIIEMLGERIKTIDIRKIQKDAAHNYEKGGIPSEIFNYSRQLCWNLWEALGSHGSDVSYMRINDQKIQITPFSFGGNNEFAKALYGQMEQRAGDLGMKLKALETYRPDFSACDHGVLSAMLLFQALAFCYDLSQAAKQNSPIEFAWNMPGGIHELVKEKSVALYADAIFAILLHNIYTKRARPQYGLQYQQDIDQNPFSYFCALMDNLQKWSRPKQINFSVMDLPEDHYLGNDFDVNVSKGRLRVVCRSTRAGKMREQLEYAEDYLPGILNLVCVTEEEI